MKGFLQFLSAVCLSILSTYSLSSSLEFSADNIGSFPHPGAHSRLDFNDADSVSITIDNAQNSEYGEFNSISKLEINFPHVNDLVVINLRRDQSGRYVAKVDGAWIYKSVLVTLNTHGSLSENVNFDINVSILDSESNINIESPVWLSYELMLFEVNGQFKDVTPKILADTITLDHLDKPLTINVYKSLKLIDGHQSMLDININWLGNGDKDLKVPVSVYPGEIYTAKAIRVNAVNIESPDPLIEFTIQEGWGGETNIGMPLNDLLMQAGFPIY